MPMARHEIPQIKKTSLRQWIIGSTNARPGFMLLGLLLFTAIVLMPPSSTLMTLLTTAKNGASAERIGGYSDFRKMNQDRAFQSTTLKKPS